MPLESSKTPRQGTQEALAVELGIDPAQVSRLAKRGMPTDSVEAAKKWRANHQQRPGRQKPIKPMVVETIPKADDETEDSYLTRVRQNEQDIYKSLRKAQSAEPDQVLRLQQWHATACRARNEVEDAMLEIQTKRGTLINKADALQALTEAFGAVLLQTDSIPKLYNQKFPGLDPAVVEPILQEISKGIRIKTEAWIRQNKLNQK